jgi:hypothetical protein
MLRGLKLLQSVSWGKSKKAVEWREKGGLIEFVLQFNAERGLVYVLNEDTTFKELATRDLFRNTQFKFPKDFNPETTISGFLLEEEAPLSIELRNEDQSFYLNNRAKYRPPYLEPPRMRRCCGGSTSSEG